MAPPSSESCNQLRALLKLLEQQLAQDQKVLNQYQNMAPPDTELISQWQETVVLTTEEITAFHRLACPSRFRDAGWCGR